MIKKLEVSYVLEAKIKGVKVSDLPVPTELLISGEKNIKKSIMEVDEKSLYENELSPSSLPKLIK